jgi:hypothetical protein
MEIPIIANAIPPSVEDGWPLPTHPAAGEEDQAGRACVFDVERDALVLAMPNALFNTGERPDLTYGGCSLSRA